MNEANRAAAVAQLLAESQRADFGIYCGAGRYGAVFAPAEQCALALGPPRSGKTSAIVVPNIVSANGTVVCISTKRDVLLATAATRRLLGPCYLFDPSDTISAPPGVQKVSWSPLNSATDWDRAVLAAEAMVGASGAGRDGSSHWGERAGALLSSIFHAAAIRGAPMGAVVSSIHRREPEEWLSALSQNEALMALDVLTGIVETDPREQSGIWSTASSVLRAYRTGAALRSATGTTLDIEALCRDRSTLFVVAGSESQEHLAPIIAGLVRDLRSVAYEQAGRGVDARTQANPPLLLVLDELANIAPLHDLPALVAEGASQGVVTLACLQDLSQARNRWGTAAEGFFSLFGAKIVLGGIGDVKTLEALSVLAGDTDVETLTVSSSRRRLFTARQQQRSVSTRRQRILPPDAVASPRRGSALCVFGAQVGRVALTPYYDTSLLRDAVGTSRGRALDLGRSR